MNTAFPLLALLFLGIKNMYDTVPYNLLFLLCITFDFGMIYSAVSLKLVFFETDYSQQFLL